MTTLSAQAAIDLLLNDPAKYSTPDAVRNLAAQVATESPGRVTVLYSGSIGGGISSNTLIEGMVSQGEDIRVINRTQAAFATGEDGSVLEAARVPANGRELCAGVVRDSWKRREQMNVANERFENQLNEGAILCWQRQYFRVRADTGLVIKSRRRALRWLL